MKRRKKQQSDFPKKKKKLGKGKRPPENATQVSFKSQSIYVPGQLEEATGPTTHRKLGLQDLLRQLSHPKPSVCRDALNGLRELFIVNTQLLIDNLNHVVNGLVTVLFNCEESVHHSLYLLLKHVYQVTPSQTISPYFECMLAGLKCGITHINAIVRLSGLKIIDLVFAHYPALLQSHISELLPYYLPLVSRGAASSSKSTLASSQGGKLTLHDSKLLVLKQILNFLTLVSFPSPITHKPHPPIINIAKETVSLSLNGNRVDLYNYLTSSSLLFRLFSSKPICRTLVSSNKETNLTDFNNQLLQSLLEYWIELSPLVTTGPSLGSGKAKLKVIDQLVELVDVLVQLFCLLFEIKGCLNEKDCNHIITHFLPSFPLPSQYNTVNIRLAYLLIITESNSLESVYEYLSKRISTLSQITQTVHILTKILTCLGNRTGKGLEQFYGSVVKLFLSVHVNSLAKQYVLLFIEQLLDCLVKPGDKFSAVFKDFFLYPYLSFLPNVLIKQFTTSTNNDILCRVIKIITCALSMKMKTVEQSFASKFHLIYGKNGFIYSCPQSLLTHAIYPISHLSALTQADLTLLSSLVFSNHLPTPVTIALIYLVHNKLLLLNDGSSNPTILAHHVSFLLSLLMGYSENALRQITPMGCVVQRDHLKLVEPLKSCREEVDKVIINCLMNSTLSQRQLLHVLEPALTQLMMSLTVFPLDTVYRLVCLLSQCSTHVSISLSQVIAPLLITCLVGSNGKHVLIKKCSAVIKSDILSSHSVLKSTLVEIINNKSLKF